MLNRLNFPTVVSASSSLSLEEGKIYQLFLSVDISIFSTIITQKIVALSFSTLVFLVRHSGLLD